MVIVVRKSTEGNTLVTVDGEHHDLGEMSYLEMREIVLSTGEAIYLMKGITVFETMRARAPLTEETAKIQTSDLLIDRVLASESVNFLRVVKSSGANQ